MHKPAVVSNHKCNIIIIIIIVTIIIIMAGMKNYHHCGLQNSKVLKKLLQYSLISATDQGRYIKGMNKDSIAMDAMSMSSLTRRPIKVSAKLCMTLSCEALIGKTFGKLTKSTSTSQQIKEIYYRRHCNYAMDAISASMSSLTPICQSVSHSVCQSVTWRALGSKIGSI